MSNKIPSEPAPADAHSGAMDSAGRKRGRPGWLSRCVSTLRRWRKRGLWLAFLILVGAWSFLAIARSAYSLRAYTVPTGSMAPAIKAGDQICVKLTTVAQPKRGEIWTFQMPTPKFTAVKRAIGLPGETIEIRSGRVFIDGRALSEPYVSAPFTYSVPPVKLGKDEYYLLGDSRDASNDSHIFGPV
ncbi:MAG TPA: signal peptidase I, partial [Isosphaeraceae bacterium]|nr:signal peptidase I [Isosphaeraceae bacterium]